MRYHAAYSGNLLQTFRDNIPVPLSSVKKSKAIWISRRFEMGSVVCPETSVRNYHFTLCNILKSADFRSPCEIDIQLFNRGVYHFNKKKNMRHEILSPEATKMQAL